MTSMKSLRRPKARLSSWKGWKLRLRLQGTWLNELVYKREIAFSLYIFKSNDCYVRYEQLEGNLNSLRNDSTKLKALVEKYQKMHAEGPGRRLVWSLMESGNLTDLRRRIGYHEQTLQLWYMTLVYGSLRRLEGGQEDIIAAIKSLRREDYRKVSASLRAGDSRPLKEELRHRGISAVDIEANMATAIDYISAPPIEKLRMESQVRSSSIAPTRLVNEDWSRGPSRKEGRFDYGLPVDNEFPVDYGRPPDDYESPHSLLRKGKFGRSSSTSAGPKYRHLEDSEEVQLERNSQKERLRKVALSTDPRVRDRRASESHGSRAPTRPVLIVHDSTLPDQSQPPTSRHRSKSRRERGRSSSDIGRDPPEQPSIIIVEHRGGRSKDRQENKNRKDLSTHSYVRRRRSSVESAGREEDKDNPRIVHVMNRIDSIPVDTE